MDIGNGSVDCPELYMGIGSARTHLGTAVVTGENDNVVGGHDEDKQGR